MKRHLLRLACFLLSITVLASAISPRFDERNYTLLADSPVTRSYFTSWARYHGRSYASQEFGYRYTVWRDNYAFIEHFNANANASYTLAINDLGDMDYDEIGRRYTGLMSTPPAHDDRAYEEAEKAAKREIEERAVPSSFDWRTENVVTPVRSQGSCGSCYVFTATGAIEGAYKIATGQLTALSDQMLLDCAQGTGNLGCSGGNMEITYSWIINNGGGVSAQSSYPPYTGVQGPCRSSAGNNGATIKAYRTVASGSESDLLVKAAMGPVSVGVNASPRSFAYYSSGTLDDPTCTSTGLNHAVLVIGWGTDASGNDYWLVKNQWGTSWGMSGYAQIARNKNMCGIASMASQPCYNADCSSTAAVPSPSRSPAAPSRSPAAASPSRSPSACTCPCSCR